MMKIALVSPGSNPRANQDYTMSPPFSLLSLAGYLINHGRKVTILDQLAGQDVISALENEKPDLVGITGTSAVINAGYRIADHIRTNLAAVVVIGGTHASAMPREALAHADYVVRGEGEEIFLELLRQIEAGTPPRKNQPLSGRPLKNIDDCLPYPFDLVDMDFYVKSEESLATARRLAAATKKTRVLCLLFSRGCPFKCIFCYNSKRQYPVRINSIEAVKAELKTTIGKYRPQSIFFFDDDLFINRRWARQLCEFLIESGLSKRLFWTCQSRAHSLDDEVLSLARRAGCVQIGLGLESGSQRVLDKLKCGMATLAQGVRAVELCHKHGIKVYGNFMIGAPGETREEMLATKDFIIKNNIDMSSLTVTTPLPGSKLFDECREKGLIPHDINWDDLNLKEGFVSCDTMPPQEFRKLYKEIARELTVYEDTNSLSAIGKRLSRETPVSLFLKILKNPGYIPLLLLRLLFLAFKSLQRLSGGTQDTERHER